jgi:RNA polymerase sigma-B factor
MASRLPVDREVAQAGDGGEVEFRVDVMQEQGGVRVCPGGDVDVATIGRLRERINAAMAAVADRVTLDLRATTFIDSSGLQLVADTDTWASRSGTEFVIIAGPPAVQHTFDVAGLSGRLPFVHGTQAPTQEFASDDLHRARDDRRLFERYLDEQDPTDRDAVVERFLPLARQLAARYQRPEEPFDDVYQVACFGLVKAVDRFDVTRGVAFSSYAVPTITGEIKRHFRDRAWSVRVPRDLQDLALRVERVIGDLTRELGRQPSVDEVAAVTDAEPEDVLEAMQASSAYRATSLDMPRAAGDDEPGATLGDTVGVVEDGYGRAEQRAMLDELMRSLTMRERQVVTLRFEHDLTQAAIGERIGVSQMQVSRVLRHAIAKLRTLAESAAAADDDPPAAAA